MYLYIVDQIYYILDFNINFNEKHTNKNIN